MSHYISDVRKGPLGSDPQMRMSTLVLSCLAEMHREKVLKNIFLALGQDAQLCLPRFQRRCTDTRHVEWVCRLWAACQGKVRVPILFPDLSTLLLHVFCQCCSAQRNPEIRVLIAVLRTPSVVFLRHCGDQIAPFNAFQLSCFFLIEAVWIIYMQQWDIQLDLYSF